MSLSIPLPSPRCPDRQAVRTAVLLRKPTTLACPLRPGISGTLDMGRGPVTIILPLTGSMAIARTG